MFNLSVIGAWEFNGSLSDQVSTRDFEATVAGEVDFQQFSKFNLLTNKTISRKGLLFKNGRSYNTAGNFSFTDMTIAFWWNSPGAIGFTRHAVTRGLQTKFAPIICKADEEAPFEGVPTFTGGTFFISEVAASATENAIRVHLCRDTSGTTVSHIFTSASYKPGLRHVLVCYLSTERLLKIDIDGKGGTLFNAPDHVFNGTGRLRLNGFVPEHTSHTTTQEGYLFDLIASAIVSSENESLRMMRYGYEFITKEDLIDQKFIDFGIEYEQPETVTTNQIIAEGGNILVSRSNGKLLQGRSPIWDREFTYLNPRSVKKLTTSVTDPDEMAEPDDGSKRESEWTTSGLRLKGVTVRA